ncbi:MAG TPA: hypothetical protein VMX77_02190 [Candidatus Bathyarchaeia archaeon]|nr:hypothetical protein [Candidatus Bathyarchaeia archaeon]
MIKQLAKFISATSNPIYVLPLGVVILLAKPHLAAGMPTWALFGFFVLEIVAPVGFFIYSLSIGKISDLEITKKDERFRLYLFTVACWFSGLILISFYGSEFLFNILLIFTLLAYVFAILTVITKISVHVGATTSLVLLINLSYGFGYLPLFLLILPVAWSRIRLGYHTYWQVWSAVLLPLILMPLGFKILGIG